MSFYYKLFSERLVKTATSLTTQKTPSCEDLSSPRKGDTPTFNVNGDVKNCSDVKVVENIGDTSDDVDIDVISSAPTPEVCKALAEVECRLETKELWDKFHELGTEMIITKTGR